MKKLFLSLALAASFLPLQAQAQMSAETFIEVLDELSTEYAIKGYNIARKAQYAEEKDSFIRYYVHNGVVSSAHMNDCSNLPQSLRHLNHDGWCWMLMEEGTPLNTPDELFGDYYTIIDGNLYQAGETTFEWNDGKPNLIGKPIF